MSLTEDEISRIREVIGTPEKKNVKPQGSGTHHQNTYTYFYVPSDFGSDTTISDDTGLGAVLRLGGYSDLEEPADAEAGHSAGVLATVQSDVYPAQHISDETGAEAHLNAPGKQTTGENGDVTKRQGILLSCDGRILVRSGEKVYVHAAEQIHIQSDQNMAVVTVNGAIDNTSGDKFTVKAKKKISLRSGVGDPDTYTARGVNNSGDKGIEIIANDGDSDVYIEGNSLYLQVNGTSTADITQNNSTIMRADNFEDIWGHNTSIFRGTFLEFYFGAGFSYRAAASLNIATALDINIGLFDVGITAFDFSLKGKEINLNETVFGAVSVDAKLAALKNDITTLACETDSIKASTNVLKSETRSIKSTMGNVQADLQNLIFFG
ncbi:hypothetical protein J7444_09180 [Labrenzia sp. R4_1]|uniref:hypothetical protein n=1 Tax=Labrenzia sp. R4_1 TaxID=2821106 RepID=UPI001ADBE3F3|nr:hypothetical protein [Labrenzia sp. R4_1]MBO9424894.1 hypothetical protein [Labrenzia sp. R4_1]